MRQRWTIVIRWDGFSRPKTEMDYGNQIES
jgi:hypothetical protein